MGLVRPGVGQKEPMGQGLHAFEEAPPVVLENVPAGQAVALNEEKGQ